MHLKVLLPFRVFVELDGVNRIVALTSEGFLGILPQRLDCVAALAPGILMWETEADGEVYAAVDEGALVKSGTDVMVSVRNAVGGVDLNKLHEAVEREFLTLDAQEKNVRAALSKLEAGLVRRLAEFQHE